MSTPAQSNDQSNPYERVASALARYRALYAPSVVAEAAALLDDLQQVADRHGVPPGSDAAGWLVTAAADSVAAKYGGRPAVERTPAELHALADTLITACARLGLTGSPAYGGGAGVAVAPVPGGPTWGVPATGLAVRIYPDGGWDLTIDQPRTPAISIHAPATADGAAEVAELLADILHGRATDPFAQILR